jgi:non-canonical (house-cleaning) NTP pyrophosphatase
MKRIKIAVGTTSKQKIGYLEEVLKELKIKADIVSTEAKSLISEQPITANETKKGSINRAKHALKEVKNIDFALGIEVGYHKYLKNKYEMFCWATIIDKNGHKVSGQSYRFLLPIYHQQILKNGKYLADNLDGYKNKGKDSVHKYIEDTLRHRKPFIVSALKDTLVRYLRKEDF